MISCPGGRGCDLGLKASRTCCRNLKLCSKGSFLLSIAKKKDRLLAALGRTASFLHLAHCVSTLLRRLVVNMICAAQRVSELQSTIESSLNERPPLLHQSPSILGLRRECDYDPPSFCQVVLQAYTASTEPAAQWASKHTLFPLHPNLAQISGTEL